MMTTVPVETLEQAFTEALAVVPARDHSLRIDLSPNGLIALAAIVHHGESPTITWSATGPTATDALRALVRKVRGSEAVLA